MTDYSSLLQTALNTETIDESRISSVKDDINTITKNIRKSWAPLKATVVSVVAKLKYPDWDTRKHQTQIGGKYSLRTIDRCNVSDYLFKHGLYDTVTEFALTRSFEKAEPFTRSYTGNISPKECKSAFLNLVEVINTTATPELLTDILVYLMLFLKDRSAKILALRNSTLEVSKEIDLLDVATFLERVNTIESGASVLPVIIVHTVLSTVQPYMFPRISVQALKEHTAADSHSNSYGDIEAFRDTTIPVIAIEVKHKQAITEGIVGTFDKKTTDASIPLKFILTTAATQKRVVNRNICIDTVTGFTTSYLQQALLFEPTICSLFLKALRTNCMDYTNLSLSLKETLNTMFASVA
jgi:hypothetical protein